MPYMEFQEGILIASNSPDKQDLRTSEPESDMQHTTGIVVEAALGVAA